MSLRNFIAASLFASCAFAAPLAAPALAQETASPTTDQVAAASQLLASDEIKGLTNIVMQDHVENLIEHNYWNATELYFSQRQDIDLTREQYDNLREEMRPAVTPVYEKAMAPIYNLVTALFSDEEAVELTQTIETSGVSGAMETALGQRFAGQALPVIQEAMNSLVFDQVYLDLQSYREASIAKGQELGYLSADLADESDAEFDMSVPEASAEN